MNALHLDKYLDKNSETVACANVSPLKFTSLSSLDSKQTNSAAQKARKRRKTKTISIDNRFYGEECNSKEPVCGTIFGPITSKSVHKIECPVKQQVEALGVLDTHHEYYLQDEVFHPYRGIEDAKIISIKKPEFVLSQSNPLNASNISNPLEKKKMLNFEKHVALARQKVKEAERLDQKRDQVIRSVYKQGIIGYDSPDNIDSYYYKDIAAQRVKQRESHLQRIEQRKRLLQSKTTSHAFDFICDQDLNTGSSASAPNSSNNFLSTFNRLFTRESPQRHSNSNLGSRFRKDWREIDIITGCKNNVAIN